MDSFADLFPTLAAPIHLIRSPARRRSLSLMITDTPEVVLRAPLRMPLATITRFVAEREAWIHAQLERRTTFSAQYPRCHGNAGDQVFLLGTPRVLQLLPPIASSRVRARSQDSSRARIRCAITPDALRLHGGTTGTSAQMCASIAAHLRRAADETLPARTRLWASTMQLAPTRITIRTFTRRWGCCTHDGEIRLNWRLIMCPLHIIDYLIVHELAHLRFHHHRPTFWRLVEKFHPEWREARRWLNTHGSAITKML